METCFSPHGIKNKNGNCNFISHNSAFLSLAIHSFSRNSAFFPRNWEFASWNSDYFSQHRKKNSSENYKFSSEEKKFSSILTSLYHAILTL